MIASAASIIFFFSGVAEGQLRSHRVVAIIIFSEFMLKTSWKYAIIFLSFFFFFSSLCVLVNILSSAGVGLHFYGEFFHLVHVPPLPFFRILFLYRQKIFS